ncbi:hypothetical protein K4G22_19855 [Streptomyces profundus]|nr:hypothetical protein K4G22_19855 [Streptomyces sp. MA3_2.13]
MPTDLDALLAQAHDDPSVLGVLLSGSQAHDGMPTRHSDHDIHVVVRDEGPSAFADWDGYRSPRLDLAVFTLAEFTRRGLPGDEQPWMRYAHVHARVLFDRLDGGIAEILERKRALLPDEARAAVDGWLDAYVNQTYRSLKSFRDGRPDLGHLDAAESMPFFLEVVFALNRRVRPYNKYLSWELANHPLETPGWTAERLLPLLRRLLADGDPGTQRELFAEVELMARAAGHDAVLDSWGTDLELLRPRD